MTNSFLIRIIFILFGLTMMAHHFSPHVLAQESAQESALAQSDTIPIFKARIETYRKNNQDTYYKVTLSCIPSNDVGKGYEYFLFYEKHLFKLDMMEDAFEMIAERENSCRCEQKGLLK